MKTLVSKPLFVMLALTGLLAGGCATTMTKPFPDMKGQVSIIDAPKDPVYMYDWAPGTYHIPDSNVYIAKLQGDEDTAVGAVLFGLVGTEITGGNIAKTVKKDLQGAEKELQFNLADITDEAIKNALSGPETFGRVTFNGKPGSMALVINPYVVFSYVDETTSRLWVVLKVEWIDYNFNLKEWYCRYIAGVDKPRPLTGEESWTANKGELMKAALAENLKLDTEVMLEDINGKLKDDKIPMQKIRGKFMFYKKPLNVDVRVLKRDEDWDVVLPLVGDDSYYAGVNILPKDFNEPLPPKDLKK